MAIIFCDDEGRSLIGDGKKAIVLGESIFRE
jgi:hypothetical protein